MERREVLGRPAFLTAASKNLRSWLLVSYGAAINYEVKAARNSKLLEYPAWPIRKKEVRNDR
jgi:hypothetical protein